MQRCALPYHTHVAPCPPDAQVVEGGEPVAVPNQEGRTTTPSVVAFMPDGGVLVGAAAKRQAALNPRNTFYSGRPAAP